MHPKGWFKTALRCLCGLAALVAVLAVPSVQAPTAAQAQAFDGAAVRELYNRARKQRMEQGRPQQRSYTRERSRKPQQRATRTKRRSQSPVVAAPAPAQEVAKRPDAKTVLVIGDFLASGLAEGLTTVFREDGGVRVVDRANGSSGIVRDDFYNWPAEIGPILDEEKPAAVVIMLGSNDRQPIKAESGLLEPRTAGWTEEYGRRANLLVTAVQERGIPLIWVGMPAFKQSALSSDMLANNDIYRSLSRTGVDFVDVWDGFVDENGAFITTGPDINGQQVRLRGSDGINMTAAGKRKLAFYAEKPLQKALGNAAAASVGLAGPAYTPGSDLRPDSQQPLRVVRTVPISLADPTLDGSAELLGADPAPGDGVDLQIRQGREQPRSGRADSFGVEKRATPLPEADGTASIGSATGGKPVSR